MARFALSWSKAACGQAVCQRSGSLVESDPCCEALFSEHTTINGRWLYDIFVLSFTLLALRFLGKGGILFALFAHGFERLSWGDENDDNK